MATASDEFTPNVPDFTQRWSPLMVEALLRIYAHQDIDNIGCPSQQEALRFFRDRDLIREPLTGYHANGYLLTSKGHHVVLCLLSQAAILGEIL